jgi:hypothetical protein
LLSDSVGGAEESRNGFGNLMPVKVTDRSTLMTASPRARTMDAKRSAVFAPRKGGRRRLDSGDIVMIL